jgi:hypothetical protein
LQSRYYNPEWCRFISADVFFDTGDGVLGTNMYAYCQGDPVNFVDPGGRKTIKTKGLFYLLNRPEMVPYTNESWALETAALTSVILFARNLGLHTNAYGITLSELEYNASYSYLTGVAGFKAAGYSWQLKFAIATISDMRRFIATEETAKSKRDFALKQTIYLLGETSYDRMYAEDTDRPHPVDTALSLISGTVALSLLIADSAKLSNKMQGALDLVRSSGQRYQYHTFLFIPLSNLKGKKIKS